MHDGTAQHAHLTYKFTLEEPHSDTRSGLDNFGARFDASNLGRFTSPDPLPGSRHRKPAPCETDNGTTETAKTGPVAKSFTVQQLRPSKDSNGGSVVTAVAADGPASKAGLKPGDVINEVTESL